MVEILHETLPHDLAHDGALPGVRPLKGGAWLRVDEAYADQVAYRRDLIAQRRNLVIWESDRARDAVSETFDLASNLLPEMGFRTTAHDIHCPDGTKIGRSSDTPLAVLGQTLQEDLCILQKQGDEHVLTAAVLCFPASWTLSEKAGRPLSDIHAPVQTYDPDLSKRVQRLFNCVQPGRPLWRNNMLRYDDPDLFQPRSAYESLRVPPAVDKAQFLRAERQSIVRLPRSDAVLFSIHSYVVRV